MRLVSARPVPRSSSAERDVVGDRQRPRTARSAGTPCRCRARAPRAGLSACTARRRAHGAGVGLHDAVDHLNQRRLARAVLAQQGMDLALADSEGHAIIGDHAGEALGDAANVEERRRQPCWRAFLGRCSARTDLALAAARAAQLRGDRNRDRRRAPCPRCRRCRWGTASARASFSIPASRNRFSKRARLVAEPIRPAQAKSCASTVCAIDKSRAWENVMIRCKASGGAAAAMAAGSVEIAGEAFGGRLAGNRSTATSTQVMAKGKSANARTTARPTWPAP